METVEAGWNSLVDADPARIVAAARRLLREPPPPPAAPLYGDGHAAERIVKILSAAP